MKHLTIVFALLFTSLFYAQEEKTDFKVNTISFEVDTVKELKNIDWKNVKEIFSLNTKNEDIEMSFALKQPNSKHKFKSSIKVGGKSKNIDSLIILAKKGVKSIIKISKKYSN